MLAKVALGWNVKNAFVAQSGVIAVTDGYWTKDDRPGTYPAWGGNVTMTASSEAMLAALMPWLHYGKRYLALERAWTLGDPFGAYFEAFVIANGGTFTRSGTAGSFGAYDWNNFDVICASSTDGPVSAAKFDAAIVTGKSALLIVIGASNTFARYGVERSGYQTQDFAPNYQGRPFNCAPLGLTAKTMTCYSSIAIVNGTETMGGTYTRYLNSVGEGVLGLWVPA